MVTISNLNIINMTPHPVRMIDPRVVSVNRSGMAFVSDELEQEEYTLQTIPGEGLSLSVQEDESIPAKIGELRLYSQMDNARFDRNIPESILGSVDMIIVSNKCARLLLTISSSIIAGTNSHPILSLFDIDKFYVPKNVVYKNIMYGKNIPVGALGLQQVTPSLSIRSYATALKLNEKMEVPREVPISAASAYKSMMAAMEIGDVNSDDFKILAEYLKGRGIFQW